MDTSKLLEYLSICIDLEKSKYIQENTYNKLNLKIATYKDEYDINCNLNNEPSTPVAENNTNKDNDNVGCISGLLFAYILGSLSFRIFAFKSGNALVGVLGGILGIIIGAYIGHLISKVIRLIFYKKYKEKERLQAAERFEQIERAKKVDDELRAGRIERNNQITHIISTLESEKNNIVNAYKVTCRTLTEAYNKNIIPEKYRSIIPICMFYDYLFNGRTYSLKRNPNGFDQGAINMYEDECFRQLILNKLDVIIDRLDAISSNQRILYDAIQEGNQKTHQLLNDINSNITNVNGNLKTIQYQNEEQIKCLKYSNYLQTLAYYDSYI